MPQKTPGKLHLPSSQAEFDHLDLGSLCINLPTRSYFRLHPIDPSSGKPWPPIFFSQKGTGRFDPPTGPGTLYVGETFAGSLMEIFDDKWGPLGDPSRSLTSQTLKEWNVTTVRMPSVRLFDATGINLSLIGTDIQLLAGPYDVTQQWALRIANHPDHIDGIYYRSRHDPAALNIALFNRGWKVSSRASSRKVQITFSKPTRLSKYPKLASACRGLQVAILP